MQNKTWTRTALLSVSIFLLLLALLGWLLYQNWERFTPTAETVTYLQVELPKDTVIVQAGIQVQNRAPLNYRLDSVNYQIRSSGLQLGYGSQFLGQTLPALDDKVLDFRFFLDKDRYKELVKMHQHKDSLKLEINLQVYVDPPLLSQKTLHVSRSFSVAIPKGPAIKIDSFFLKSFSPEAGYAFQLNLNTGNPDLPDLQLHDLAYHIRISDSLTINGTFPEPISVQKGEAVVQIPVQLETADMVTLMGLQLSDKNVWAYQAKADAVLQTSHSLFRNIAISVEKTGTVDIRRFGSGSVALPTVKHLEALKLRAQEKKTYLQASLLIHNPLQLPIYIDSANYIIRHNGKILARGGNNHEKTLPARGDQRLQVNLAVNNRLLGQLMDLPKTQTDIPLDVELALHYNLKNHKPQRITIAEKITVPNTQGPGFEVLDIGVRSFSPKRARLLL
ncbi:MAG: hypothetical protein EOP50_14820, partial [Sphingobacteriales bacterium]